MTFKPVILLASARKDSDTKVFLEEVFKNTDHKLVDLLDFSIQPYDYNNQYSAQDKFFTLIEEEILTHQSIVFATPVYWYAMSGLMKIFFDRLTDLVTIKKQLGRQLKGKSTFLLAVGTDEEMPAGFETPFKLTSAYLNMLYEGCIYYSTKNPKQQELIQDSIDNFISKIRRNMIDL
jgi:multimeric flavodoxin WrbA